VPSVDAEAQILPSGVDLPDMSSPGASPTKKTTIQRATVDSVTVDLWTIWYAARYGKLARVRSILDRKAVASIDVQEFVRPTTSSLSLLQCSGALTTGSGSENSMVCSPFRVSVWTKRRRGGSASARSQHGAAGLGKCDQLNQ
jgi:hypothetical protein